MASKFQSRLVGTIILASLGVLFLPDLFDGEKQHYQEEFASIPLKPESETVFVDQSVVAPEAVPLPEEIPTETVTLADPPAPAVEEPEPESWVIEQTEVVEVQAPVAPSSPKPHMQDSGWAVQLGTFSNFNNAKGLVESLRNAGYQAHVIPNQPKEGEFVRVFVGPDLSKERLDAEREKLRELTGLDGRLVRFNPLNP
uniref:SPOR domain-containing protein n=1 Tax=Thaumasiovibrio occultus TaxID=1891184 RepID=UPI000B34DEF8|nr:SPOR domain-containing protein [Thaumasiovibrio occultus]